MDKYALSKLINSGFIFFGFILFTLITVLPTSAYYYFSMLPEAQPFIDMVKIFGETKYYYQYILPNIIYLILWGILTVHRLVKKRFHSTVLWVTIGVSAFNWWTLYLLVDKLQVFNNLFGGIMG